MRLPSRTSQDVIAGRGSQMLAVCNMLTGLLRCWHVRSWQRCELHGRDMVGADGRVLRNFSWHDKFGPCRPVFELSPSNIVLQRRSSAVVEFLCRGLPIVELALLGPWRWSCHVGRKKFSSMVDIYEDKFSKISK